MAISRELADLLQSNLDKVQEPAGYAALHRKLMQSRPKHAAPVIRQSPENTLKIDSSDTE
jgi:hypothetical protein